MRRRLSYFVVAVVLALLIAVPALARGGNGNKATDVCWMQGATEIRARFQTTGSGIVQEFRYEPTQMHGVFKPAADFSEPDEEGWFLWTGHYYGPCEGETDLVTDFLKAGTQYWVKLEVQD